MTYSLETVLVNKISDIPKYNSSKTKFAPVCSVQLYISRAWSSFGPLAPPPLHCLCVVTALQALYVST